MARGWLADLANAALDDTVVRAVVIATEGSTPREVGAAMLVHALWTEGTVGGGALEHDVIARARQLLTAPDALWTRSVCGYHLGPELNQCCGGVVRLLLERFSAGEVGQLKALMLTSLQSPIARDLVSGAPLRLAMVGERFGLSVRPLGGDIFVEPAAADLTPLTIYGAGHVGRAVVRVLEGLPFAIRWIDIARERFPEREPTQAEMVVDAAPDLLCAHAPEGAFHLVMTHSHALDEAIVTAILGHGHFGYLGLIGSKTKRARFRHRLERAGLPQALIEQLHCPIGLTGLPGKAPVILAVSVVADLLIRRQSSV